MEYDENIVHFLYRPIVRTGLAFGAQRWMTTLQFLGVMMSFVDPTVCLNGEKIIAMLAQRMTHNFYAGVCATTHQWEIIQLANGEDAKFMKRNNIGDLGEHSGTMLSATKTIWLPVKQQCLFEFLINDRTRSQWDVLSNSGIMQLTVHISKGQNLDCNISLFHANGDDAATNQNSTLILQDTCMDTTRSFLYAPIDPLAMNMVKKKGDPSGVAIFPCGIAIVPDCFQDYIAANNSNRVLGKNDNGFCSGSIMTIGFQIFLKSINSKKHSIEAARKANHIISGMIKGIRTSLKCK